MHCSSIMKRSIEDREHSELLHGPLRWEGGFSNGSCIPGRRCFSPMEPPVPMALIVVTWHEHYFQKESELWHQASG